MESESSHGGPLGGKLRSDLIVVTREHKPLCPITSQFRTQIRLLADFGEVFHSLPRRLFLTYIFLTGNIVQLEVPGAMTGKWTGGRSAPERRQGLMPRLLGATPGDQPRSQRPWIGGKGVRRALPSPASASGACPSPCSSMACGACLARHGGLWLRRVPGGRPAGPVTPSCEPLGAGIGWPRLGVERFPNGREEPRRRRFPGRP
jgi:hypothetical protein